jgi:membrane associated rhomboid family serine protease
MSLTDILHTPMTLLVLLATIAISIAGFRNPRLTDALIVDMQAIMRRREYYRLATSGFVHGDPMHLFMNMLTLFFLGPGVERMTGWGGFLIIYFASLIAGSAWAVMEHFRSASYRALGASGAVSGVTVVFALFAPFASIIVFILPMPAIVFAVLYIAWSAYASGRVNDGVGHEAHLGGALMGLVLTCLIWPAAIENLVSDVRSMFGS